MLWWNIYLASTWQIPVLCSEPCVSSKLSNYLHTLIISSLSPARGKALAQPLFLVTSNINLGLVPRIKWYFDYLLYIACSSKLISNLIMNSLSILNIYLYSLGFKSLSLFICKMNTSWPFRFFRETQWMNRKLAANGSWQGGGGFIVEEKVNQSQEAAAVPGSQLWSGKYQY